jgi:hypothetical protein
MATEMASQKASEMVFPPRSGSSGYLEDSVENVTEFYGR